MNKVPVIKVSLLTGFLGSGKTTLLNTILKHKDMAETAVLVNEFGDIGIDHSLVENVDPDLIELTTGCICCTIQGDLSRALKELFLKRINKKTFSFNRVLIESTGLADPVPVIHTLVNDPVIAHRYVFDGIITTVDAIHGNGQLHRHEECKKQVAVADRLVVTKTDIAAPKQVVNCLEALDRLNPSAARYKVISGEIHPDRLFNCGLFDPETKSYDVQNWLKAEDYKTHKFQSNDHDHVDYNHKHIDHNHKHIDHNRHDETIRAWCLEIDKPISWPVFIAWIQTLIDNYGEKILRIKGIVHIEGEDQPIAIHGVQHVFHPPAKLPKGLDVTKTSKLVFIVDNIAGEIIEKKLNHLQHVVTELA